MLKLGWNNPYPFIPLKSLKYFRNGLATLKGSLKPPYWSVLWNYREMDICMPVKLTRKVDAASQIKSALKKSDYSLKILSHVHLVNAQAPTNRDHLDKVSSSETLPHLHILSMAVTQLSASQTKGFVSCHTQRFLLFSVCFSTCLQHFPSYLLLCLSFEKHELCDCKVS